MLAGRFLLALLSTLLVSFPAAGWAAQDPWCAELFAENSAEDVGLYVEGLGAEIRRARAVPPEAQIETLEGGVVTAAQLIQADEQLRQALNECLQAQGAEPRPVPAEEVATEEPADGAPEPARLGFVEWQPGGVCVLRTAYCIDYEGNRFGRGDAAAPAQPADAPPANAEAAGPGPFAGTWNGRFEGLLRVRGCETTESGSFSLRLQQAQDGAPVSGTASYMGTIVGRNCGSTSISGQADNCGGAPIGPVTPTGRTIRFQLTCAGSTETVTLNLTSPTEASGNKTGTGPDQAFWDMTFGLTRS